MLTLKSRAISLCRIYSISLVAREPLFTNLPNKFIDTSQWLPTIGLEIHAQLTSACTKLFSSAPYEFLAPPNTQVAPVDAALPGSMPILNRVCVESTIAIALALNCRLNLVSRFDRKHYFYADSPAGYQITQHELPIGQDGWFDFTWSGSLPSPSSVNKSRGTIRRIQLEQDSAKSVHDEKNGRILVDLNRAGVGLVEIVTDPDFTCGDETAAFVQELCILLNFLKVCSANMSTGELRADINVSIGPSLKEQGPIVEIKNVNSLRAIKYSVDYELKRQFDLAQKGADILNETRSYDSINNKTIPMRDKETVQDYRFLPEPDLSPLYLVTSCEKCRSFSPYHATELSASPSRVYTVMNNAPCLNCISIKHGLHRGAHDNSEMPPLLPNEICRQLVFQHRLDLDKALVLITVPVLKQLYDLTVTIIIEKSNVDFEFIYLIRGHESRNTDTFIKRETAYWCAGVLYSLYSRFSESRLPSPSQLADFVLMNLSGQLHGTSAEKVLSLVCEAGPTASPLEVAEQCEALLFNQIGSIKATCDRFLEDNKKLVSTYLRKRSKKALRRLVTNLLDNSDYNASRYNPAIVERLIIQHCDRLVPASKSSDDSSSRPPE